MKENAIELESVNITYREKSAFFKKKTYCALKCVTFSVIKGETLGIIGRNGAGKSTLLRLLAGIIKPDSGRITFNVKSISLMALAAGFDQNLSGRQNALISGMLLGYRRKDIEKLIDPIKEYSELQAFFDKPVKTYSSGMRARLGFSIAMHASPEVLLIDEVLGVGDIGFRKKAKESLTAKINSGITVIIVSHSEHEMKNLVDRVVWIDDGKVRKTGKPVEVFPEYNLNIYFSTFGIRINSFKKKDGFNVFFENVKFDKSSQIVYFDVVILSNVGDNFDEIIVSSNSNCEKEKVYFSTLTPGYHNQYKTIQSARARYKGLTIEIGKEYFFSYIKNKKNNIVFNLFLGRY